VLAAFAVGGSSHFSVLSAAISSTSTVELVSKRFLTVRLYICVVECILCRGEIVICVCTYTCIHMHICIRMCVCVCECV
jgi:hypothetical protein